jgi:hypothetical protein
MGEGEGDDTVWTEEAATGLGAFDKRESLITGGERGEDFELEEVEDTAAAAL